MAKRKLAGDESTTNEGPMLPLHAAITKDDLEAMIELVQRGAAQVHPETRETPLHTAARVGALKCLRWLLDNHIKSPFDKARNGSSPVHYAAVYGQLEAMKVLLMHNNQNSEQIAEQTDENKLSILSLATLQGDIRMVKWITSTFTQLGHISDKKGNLPIHFAAAAGNLPIIKHLVKQYGARYADAQDTESSTKPVYYAAQDGKIDILEYLINELDLDPVARDSSGNSTIHAAVMGNRLAAVKWLVRNIGPEVIEDRTKDGASPLHIAAAHGFAGVLEYLIQAMQDKTKINPLDAIKATPAHDAAEFGQLETMLVLLRHGADINIKDTENKTPFELAVDKGNTEVVKMIADFREHGPMVLSSYEKGTRSRSATAPAASLALHKQQSQGQETPELVRTNSEVAADLSNEISKVQHHLDKRHDRELTRKRSLQELDRLPSDDEPVTDTGDELEQHLLGQGKDRGRSRSKPNRSDEDHQEDLVREAGPDGQLYTKVRKSLGKKMPASGSHQGSDLDDQMSEAMSHASSQFVRMATSLDPQDPGYYSINHAMNNIETASNFSRPSRVKHHHDPDDRSEQSFRSGSSMSQNLRNGRHNVPGFYPPYGPGYQPQYPGHGPAHMRKLPKSASGSSLGSQTSAGNGHRIPYVHHVPPGYPPPPQFPHYPYYPNMVAQYYGYPWPGQAFPIPRPKTMEERIHMDALQQHGHAPYRPHGYPPHDHYRHNRRAPPPPKHGHKGDLKHRSRPSSGKSAPPTRPRPRHTDRDIGFGPSVADERHQPRSMEQEEKDFHPPPPPITKSGTTEDAAALSSLDGNFILVRPDEQGMTQSTAGTTLVRAPPPKTYDGRWDQYIMTDSEEEREVDSSLTVSRLAECALIISLGTVCGLKGMGKIRGKVAGKKPTTTPAADRGKGQLAAAWDLHTNTSQKRKGGQLGDIDLANLLPDEFADMADQRAKQNWDNQGDSTGENQAIKEDQDWAQTLGMSLNPTSMSTEMSMKQLGGSLRGRHFAMMDLGPSLGGQLTRQAQQGNDSDDNDDDIISIIHGIDAVTPEGNKEKRKSDKPGKADKSERRGREKKSSKKGEKPSSKDRDKKRSKKDKRVKDQGVKKEGRSKMMQVIATPTFPQNETKETTLTVIAGSEEERSRVVKLTSQVVPANKLGGKKESVTSIGVRAPGHRQKGSQGPPSTAPVEVKNVFDSLSDTELSSDDMNTMRVDPLQAVAPSTDSLDDIFAKTQKEIEQIIAGFPGEEKSPDVPSARPDSIAVEESVGKEGREHFTETTITFKMNPSTEDDEEEGQDEELKRLRGIFPANSAGVVVGREEVDAADNPDVGALLRTLNTSDASPQQAQKLQMIQQIMTYKDPELMKQLLGLLSEGWNPMRDQDTLESTSNTQLVADIEQKLVQVQEKQRQDTQEQIRSQAEFSQSLQRRLEEQAEKHLQNIQQQFEQQRELLLQQLDEQRKAMEADRSKRREEGESDSRPSRGTESEDSRKAKRHREKGKKQRHRKRTSDSESETEDDQFVVVATPLPVSIPKQKVKTMQAELYQQKALVWDDFTESSDADAIPEAPPLPTVSYLLESLRHSQLFERSHLMAGARARAGRITSIELERTQKAMERFSSVSSLEDDVEMQVARPQTTSNTRHADILRIPPDDTTIETSVNGQQSSLHQVRATAIYVNQ